MSGSINPRRHLEYPKSSMFVGIWKTILARMDTSKVRYTEPLKDELVGRKRWVELELSDESLVESNSGVTQLGRGNSRVTW